MPSSAGYLVTAVLIAVLLFFALWWAMTGEDEAPWLPAGLAASVVILVALSAREVIMRRAWTRYLLEQGIHETSARELKDKPQSTSKRPQPSYSLTAALRAIQKQSATADAGSSADSHLDVFHLCRTYANHAEERLASNNLPAEKRATIRAGQERVRALQKHHLLTWARESSRALTYEAQQRARTSDKIETANRALHCLDSVLKVYPDVRELDESKIAIREFIASVKVAHWVELAERSAFKGHYRRAIDRYKDALFYLNRETVNEEVRMAGASRIAKEIESLKARVRAAGREHGEAPDKSNGDGRL